MTAINYARRYWRQLQKRGYRLVEIAPGGKSSQRKGWHAVGDLNLPACDALRIALSQRIEEVRALLAEYDAATGGEE